MAEVLSELSGHLPADPDAQATITDFVDYTEYYPSDLFRSLTLIGKLDDAFLEHTATVHKLTKTYATLPTLPVEDRPEPVALRKEISLALHHALRCRESSYAEAARLSTVTDNLTHRIRTIKRKLQALPKPPSREPTPVPKAASPLAQRNRKSENERAPRIKLKFEDAKPQPSGPTPQRRHRSRRIVVPGEVLPPFDPNSPGIDDYSESEPEPLPTTSHRARDKTPKLPKFPKADKIKLPKPLYRLPGSSGTNVHSSVAGISVSNAMALLDPPPANPALGSKHAPWLSLTEWELNKIRKRMKKNADWLPSDIMVQRELAAGGRGPTNKARAQALAAEAGEEFLDEQPEDFKRPVNFRRRTSEPVYNADGEELLVSRGMKLNEAKKLKRKLLLQEAAEREEANRRITEAGLAINDLFSQDDGGLLGDMIKLQPLKSTPKKELKRKRVSGTAVDTSSNIELAKDISPESKNPAPKKIKLVRPRSIREEESPSHADKTLTDGDSIVLDAVGATSTTRSGRSATSTRARNSPKRGATPSSAILQSDTEQSRGSTSIKLKLNTSKAASSVTSERRGSLRGGREGNSSTPKPVSLPKKGSADSAIIANGASEIMLERRSKRSAADVSPANSSTDSSRKSSKPPRKKTPPEVKKRAGSNSRAKSAGADDVDESGSEPTYCICGGPSSGRMIACDDAHCKTEWFHLECVGLDPKDVYSRATWFCPECRRRHGVKGVGIKS